MVMLLQRSICMACSSCSDSSIMSNFQSSSSFPKSNTFHSSSTLQDTSFSTLLCCSSSQISFATFCLSSFMMNSICHSQSVVATTPSFHSCFGVTLMMAAPCHLFLTMDMALAWTSQVQAITRLPCHRWEQPARQSARHTSMQGEVATSSCCHCFPHLG